MSPPDVATRLATRRMLAAVLALAAIAAALVAPLASLDGPWTASAQGEPVGVIRGEVTSGTAGEPLAEGVEVNLITLEDEAVSGTSTAEVVDGRYEFAVEPDPAETHILRLAYAGIEYFGDPVTLTPEAPEAQRDLEVFATTTEMPKLTIDATVVTVVGIDREAGQLALLRQDFVENPGDRVFIGDGAGWTLRIPAPDGTLEATAETTTPGEDEFSFEGGVIATATPLRPGAQNSIVTRYLVEYDRGENAYGLRVTAPLATEHIEVRVPPGFARELAPLGPAQRVDDIEPEADLGVDRLHVVELSAASAPGEGLLMDLNGLAIEVNSNPLTEPIGAAIGGLAALAIIAAAAVVVSRRGPRADPKPDAEAT